MQNLIRAIWNRPYLGLIAALLLIAIGLPTAQRIEISGSLSGFEAKQAPIFEEAQRFDSLFGRADQLVFIGLKPNGLGDFWKACAQVERQCREIIPGARTISPRAFAIRYFNLTDPEHQLGLDSQLSLLQSHPQLGQLIAADKQSILVVVQHDLETLPENFMESLLAEPSDGAEPPIVYSIPQLETAIRNSLIRDIVLICSLIFVLVMGYLVWAYKSWKVPLFSLLAMTPSLLFAFLLYGLFNIPINVITALALPVVLVLSLCDSVHFLGALQHEGSQPSSLLRLAIPSLFSSLTSAAAFFSFFWSETANIQHLGLITGTALMAEFALSFLLAPLWMKNSQINSPAPKVLRATLQHFQTQKRSWTWGFALLGIGALLLMPSLRFHSDPEAFYPRGESISEAHDHFNRQFQSQKSLSIWMENPQEKPGFLETCQSFCEQWKGKDGLVSAQLPLQQSEWNEGLSIPLPELKNSNPASPYYNAEKQVYKADFKFETTEQLLAFVRDSAFQTQLKSLGFPAYTHSGVLLYEYINQDLARSLFKSLGTSGLAIVFILWLLTRSWKQALIGLVPNLLPLSAAVWAFTLLGVDLNLITAITAVVCLGLLDDDTVHVLYRRMILKEPLGGLEHSMLDSAILLSLGFGLFAFSRFYPTQVFGAVSALVFVVGILGELTFFQQVLDRFGRKD